MPPALDLTGQAFGWLTVVWLSQSHPRGVRSWDCWCDPQLGGCGTWVPAVTAGSLRSGNSTSCGCRRLESVPEARWPDGRRPPCLVCGKRHFAAGLCKAHHAQWLRRGKPPVGDWAKAVRDGREHVCEICGAGFSGYKQRCCTLPECQAELRRRDTRDLKARRAAGDIAAAAAKLRRLTDGQ